MPSHYGKKLRGSAVPQRKNLKNKLTSKLPKTAGKPLKFKQTVTPAQASVNAADALNATTGTYDDNTGAVQALGGTIQMLPPPIGRGTQRDERIGNRIMLRGADVRISLQMFNNSLGGLVMRDQPVRVMIVEDRQNNESNWGATDLDSILATAAAGPYNHFNLDDRKRWRVLYDKTYTLRGSEFISVASNGVGPVSVYEFHCPYKVPVTYTHTSSSGQWGDIRDNYPHILVLPLRDVEELDYRMNIASTCYFTDL